MSSALSPEALNELNELNKRWGIPGVLRFEAGPGGLTRAMVTTPAATGSIYLHGAHLAAYQPAGQRSVLFMSSASEFHPGKPIRGGVPICFPWFGPRRDDPAAPSHGLARLQAWTFADAQQTDHTLHLELTTTVDPFRVRYRVSLGPSLGMTLRVRNNGPAPASFEEALHTYLSVSHAHRVWISGLEGGRYLSKSEGMVMRRQNDEAIRLAGEIDRVYLDTQATCVLHDPDWNRRIIIEKEHSRSTIVWNPGAQRAAAVPDLGDQDWTGMVCIESGNVMENAVELGPGQEHQISAQIRVESL